MARIIILLIFLLWSGSSIAQTLNNVATTLRYWKTSPVNIDIPTATDGYNGQQNLSASAYAAAQRFVVPQTITIDRIYYVAKIAGATCDLGDGTGYGAGNGGIFYGRIVNVDASGLPIPSQILASESVNACTRYTSAATEFSQPAHHNTFYAQFSPPLTLVANTMYAFILSNTDATPGSGGDGTGGGNNASPNYNYGLLADIGPHQNLTPGTTGGLFGWDPREAALWSNDSGATWVAGTNVGWYHITGAGVTWPIGFRLYPSGTNIAHGWVTQNWPNNGSAKTATYTAQADTVLTQAGGASNADGSDGCGTCNIGVITVTNLTTSVSATTASLGNGVQRAALSQAVPVAAGQQFTVTATGWSEVGSNSIFGDIFTPSLPNQQPMLFATPFPPFPCSNYKFGSGCR